MGEKPLRGQEGLPQAYPHHSSFILLLLRAICTPLSRTNSILWNCCLELGYDLLKGIFHHQKCSQIPVMVSGCLVADCLDLWMFGGTRMALQPVDAKTVHWEVSALGEPWGVCLPESLNISPLLLAQSCFNRCRVLRNTYAYAFCQRVHNVMKAWIIHTYEIWQEKAKWGQHHQWQKPWVVSWRPRFWFQLCD